MRRDWVSVWNGLAERWLSNAKLALSYAREYPEHQETYYAIADDAYANYMYIKWKMKYHPLLFSYMR